jgi:hypothetical protein
MVLYTLIFTFLDSRREDKRALATLADRNSNEATVVRMATSGASLESGGPLLVRLAGIWLQSPEGDLTFNLLQKEML